MKIGVLSDTHGSMTRMRAAIATFEAFEVSAVLHCGDVGGANVIEALAAWPAHFVRGNVDAGQEAELSAACRPPHVWHGEIANFDLDGLVAAIVHGDDERRKRDAIESGRYDVVCYGHSHRAEIRTVGPTLCLNPGALYRTSVPSIAILETRTREARIVQFS